jgi:hypothetical protein
MAQYLAQYPAWFGIGLIFGAAAAIWLIWAFPHRLGDHQDLPKSKFAKWGTALTVIILVVGAFVIAVNQPFPTAVGPKIVTAPLPAPIALSDDEKQFRFDLRRYVLSNISEQGETFAGMALSLVNIDSNTHLYKDRETTAAADHLFDAAFRSKYLDILNALRQDADKPIGEMDVRKIANDIKTYYFAYNQAQLLFIDFLKLSGQDPNKNDMLAHWLVSDARASQAFHDLLASPSAKQYEIGGYFAPADARFNSYLKQYDSGSPVAK